MQIGIESAFRRFNAWLERWPNDVLTWLLLGLALLIVVIALRATALEKAIAAAWLIFP